MVKAILVMTALLAAGEAAATMYQQPRYEVHRMLKRTTGTCRPRRIVNPGNSTSTDSTGAESSVVLPVAHPASAPTPASQTEAAASSGKTGASASSEEGGRIAAAPPGAPVEEAPVASDASSSPVSYVDVTSYVTVSAVETTTTQAVVQHIASSPSANSASSSGMRTSIRPSPSSSPASSSLAASAATPSSNTSASPSGAADSSKGATSVTSASSQSSDKTAVTSAASDSSVSTSSASSSSASASSSTADKSSVSASSHSSSSPSSSAASTSASSNSTSASITTSSASSSTAASSDKSSAAPSTASSSNASQYTSHNSTVASSTALASTSTTKISSTTSSSSTTSKPSATPSNGCPAGTSFQTWSDDFSTFDHSKWTLEAGPATSATFGKNGLSMKLSKDVENIVFQSTKQWMAPTKMSVGIKSEKAPGIISAMTFLKQAGVSDEIDLELIGGSWQVPMWKDGKRLEFGRDVSGTLASTSHNLTSWVYDDANVVPFDKIHQWTVDWKQDGLSWSADGKQLLDIKAIKGGNFVNEKLPVRFGPWASASGWAGELDFGKNPNPVMQVTSMTVEGCMVD